VPTLAKLLPRSVIDVPPVVGALNIVDCEIVGESYVNVEMPVATTDKTCILTYVTSPLPVGCWHLTDDVVVQLVVEHTDTPSLTDGVRFL
jgi:hypothetical protein